MGLGRRVVQIPETRRLVGGGDGAGCSPADGVGVARGVGTMGARDGSSTSQGGVAVAVGQGETVPESTADGLQSAHTLVYAPAPMSSSRGTAILNFKSKPPSARDRQRYARKGNARVGAEFGYGPETIHP